MDFETLKGKLLVQPTMKNFRAAIKICGTGEDFVLVSTQVFENILNDYFGHEIASPTSITKSSVEIAQGYLNEYSNEGIKLSWLYSYVKDRFGKINPAPIICHRDFKEMFFYLFFYYQLSYLHYILGKYHNMNDGEFPCNCCGYSSNNLGVALWENGIPAVVVGDYEDDHDCVVIPFKFNTMSGVVVVDPTSDQFDNRRNNIMIKIERGWKYMMRREGRGEVDFHPTIIWCAPYKTGEYKGASYDSYIDDIFKGI